MNERFSDSVTHKENTIHQQQLHAMTVTKVDEKQYDDETIIQAFKFSVMVRIFMF